MDADLVAEQLLDDMLMDTAGRIQEQKHDEQVGRDAAMLMGLPTAESLMQRLHQMEVRSCSTEPSNHQSQFLGKNWVFNPLTAK